MCNVQICLWVVLFLLRSTPPSCSCLKKRIARVRAGTERHKNRSRELKGGRYGKIGWNLSWNLIFSKYETRMTSRNVQAHGARLKAHMRYVYISLYIIYITHDYTWHVYIYIIYIMCISIVWPPSVLTQICCPSRRTIWKPDSLMASWLASLEPSHVPKAIVLQKCTHYSTATSNTKESTEYILNLDPPCPF